SLRRRALLTVLGGCFIASAARAQDADAPIRLVVPGGPGSSIDVAARLVAARLSEVLGQQIVVDNRPGASGAIGAQIVARSRADGATLLYGTAGTHGINSSLFNNLPYDPVRDFEPVIAVGSTPNVLVVRPDLGVKTLSEFVAAARRDPGRMTIGS